MQIICVAQNIFKPLRLIFEKPQATILLGFFLYILGIQFYPTKWTLFKVLLNAAVLLLLFLSFGVKRTFFDISRVEITDDGIVFFSLAAFNWGFGKKGRIAFKNLSVQEGRFPGFFSSMMMIIKSSGLKVFNVSEKAWGKASYLELKQNLISKGTPVSSIERG